MEQIADQPSADFQKGFNEGYLLRQHLPELANELKASLKSSRSERTMGLLDGIGQYEKETDKSFIAEWRSNDLYDDIDHIQDRDRDEPEPEHD